MFMFKPVFNWVLKYRKKYQHIKACTCWGMKVLEDFLMGYENLKGKFGWAMSFLKKKLYFLPPQSRVLIMTSPLYYTLIGHFRALNQMHL